MSETAHVENISHFIEVGFQTMVAVLVQIREGRKGEPTPNDLEDAAILLRRVSANLRPSGW